MKTKKRRGIELKRGRIGQAEHKAMREAIQGRGTVFSTVLHMILNPVSSELEVMWEETHRGCPSI